MYSQQWQDNVGNVINAASLVLGLINLQENREQTRYNDVHAANDEQAEYLLNEISQRFIEQNAILEKQNRMLERLIELLEGNDERMG